MKDSEITKYQSRINLGNCNNDKCVGRNTENGRIGLFNNKLSIRKGVKIIESQRIDYGEEWIEAIKNEFSITLDYSEKELTTVFDKTL